MADAKVSTEPRRGRLELDGRPMAFERSGDRSSPLFVLAHGAGASMSHDFMVKTQEALNARGISVLRFNFPYMVRSTLSGRKAAPDRLPTLVGAFQDEIQAAAQEQRPLLIGGKSMGGRIASLVVDQAAIDQQVRGCICLGYPFHPPGKPLQLRTEHLAGLQTPTLILQGERDSFGRREEVETYTLSPQVQLRWIPSGDHSFKPTRSSGLSEAENWATAAALSDQFLRERVLC